ncbi:DUF3570 domain-containing protein [Cellulophaga baltica]|uniref:DUF3570 domain-containing protein n=2 Tax=Cellulophaga baltica TaxID=76594 RepID=A0A1G7JQ12_9FLAO|nr:DUF3570 domain-containing protein [Cellulophaga baltica]AIY15155.1 hypothetical protein M667_19440 [Cellulophaga baltica NN016038]AIZ43519.1 hypothetical protein M666_19365 [Cellulophaga baltica 18]MCR1024687.1 DUF3570 domain-containing protein [Cellulophaga baltica]SDF27040.1 Protein of unknown function [Cellulophaga baltica]
MQKNIFIFLVFLGAALHGQETTYKKRVLETTEVDALFSYYSQDGANAAVSGGDGSEELTDVTSTVIVRLPMNDDDVLTLDVGISAYSSASSSNINPLDGSVNERASPFIASSGASQSDVLAHINPTYQHSSDDRNKIWNANAYFSSEYDYSSLGVGGGYAQLFNEKNTEVTINAKVYFDSWNPQYPIELRDGFFDDRVMGTGTYAPSFTTFDSETRNSYSLSLGVTQILSKRMQGSLFLDVVAQDGLLSTPFQRVYFSDKEDFFIEDFQLADDVERLPDTRFKIPIGGRLNYFINDYLVLRSYYRFYTDDWGVTSHTASLELPIKISSLFTLYPTYRYYTQTAADYFYAKEEAVSTLDYYTSDYDLSEFNAHQYGFGIRYKDIFTNAKLLSFGLKTIDLRFSNYDRSDGLNSYIFTFGTTFVR